MISIDFNELSTESNPQLWTNIHNGYCADNLSLLLTKHTIDKQNNTRTMSDNELTHWLISLFNDLFKDHQVTLVHASSVNKEEPEYIPARYIDNNLHHQNTSNTNNLSATNDMSNSSGSNILISPAMICFAHGFFASALHELSHWSIAGKHRRTLPDFGYWYEPDGRNEDQQQKFEQVEIKPQAIECLLTLACNHKFRVSQDNLFSDFDTSNSTFENDVYQQAIQYLSNIKTLPKDAYLLITVLYKLCRSS